ncbi:MAG: hypothetical protein N2248_04665 [candidate division WOR-3 bacterium]|nr:hypothetical protein [candidate division WOR-3 bacterium]
MILEPPDLLALRLAETRHYLFDHPDLRNAGFTIQAYRARLDRLASAGILRSFHLTLVVPPLAGGNWAWAALLGRAEAPYDTAHQLTSRLPFITEILFNACFPANIGPNLALLFFSRDLENETRFIQNLAGLRELEVFKIREYSYPVSLPLSGEEKAFIRFLIRNPDADAQTISTHFGQNENWVRAKLDRLLWTEENHFGIFRIQPAIDWSKAENFGHFHFLLETGHRPEEIARLTAENGFQLVMSGRPLGGRYLTLEADVWGMPELINRIDLLERLNGVRVVAIVYNQEVLINTTWVEKLLGT